MNLTKLFLASLLLLASASPAYTQGSFWMSTGGPRTYYDVRALAVNSQGHVYAGTWTDGTVWKTTDNGATWVQCSPIPNPNPILWISVDADDHLFVSMFLKGVYRSTNGGTTWELKNNGLTDLTLRQGVVDDKNYVWVPTESGAFRSTDDGETWTMKHEGLSVQIDLDSSHAIVTSDGPHLYRSFDHGDTWASTPLTGVGLLGIHPDGSYYANDINSDIFRSTDYGTSWVDLHTPVSWSGYTAHITFTLKGDVFYARDGDIAGILHSTDNGSTWEVLNDGLTTTRTIPIMRHPNGYVFVGTNGAGVFRSRYPTSPVGIPVSVPDTAVAFGTAVRLPIEIGDVTGRGILSFQFALAFNAPDSILSCAGEPLLDGTLCAMTGWHVIVNADHPNQVTVGGYGATPLEGSGSLVALNFMVSGGATAGDYSNLTLSDFLFNGGTPEAATRSGKISIKPKICGDADENGLVQAYDASLTLREATGPFPPPPPPLSAQGKLNADVDVDGSVTAYDAALILRNVVGLGMPQGVTTCFGGGGPANPSKTPPSLQVTVAGVERGIDRTVVLLKFSGFSKEEGILSLTTDLSINAGDPASATELAGIPSDYVSVVNRRTDRIFRVGVIHPVGITPGDFVVSVSAGNPASLDEIALTNIRMNKYTVPDILLKGVVTAVGADGAPAPSSYRLIGCYPNPFNPSTTIVFELPEQTHVRMDIFNAQGVLVRSLTDRPEPAGRHEIVWDGTNSGGTIVASGEYFCRIQAGRYVSTIKLLTLK